MTKWRDISSAPGDGTSVLLFRHTTPKGTRTIVGFFDLRWGSWQSLPGNYGVTPTHWQELPDPPVAA